MISTEASVLEACGGLIPDPRDLRTLLVHQKAKGLLGVKGTAVPASVESKTFRLIEAKMVTELSRYVQRPSPPR